MILSEMFDHVTAILRKSQNPVASFLEMVDLGESLCADPIWNELRAIDKHNEVARFSEWFRAMLVKHPLPGEFSGIWLTEGLPADDETVGMVNVFGLYVIGPNDYDFSAWQNNYEYAFKSEVMTSIRCHTGPAMDAPGVVDDLAGFMLSLGWCSLLGDHVGSCVEFDLLRPEGRDKSVFVAGFASGNREIAVGIKYPDKWVRGASPSDC